MTLGERELENVFQPEMDAEENPDIRIIPFDRDTKGSETPGVKRRIVRFANGTPVVVVERSYNFRIRPRR